MQNEIISDPQSFIGTWFLKDISICDRIINYFETNKSLQHKGRTTLDLAGTVEHRDDIKKSTDMQLNSSYELCFAYLTELKKISDLYIEQYPMCNNYGPWSFMEPVNIQKYNPGDGYYVWHSERINAVKPFSTRHLVFMTYLNDVNDGGETEFYHQKIKIKPRKGLTVIWPADWTHTHRGVTSQTEVKYIVTGWYNYVE